MGRVGTGWGGMEGAVNTQASVCSSLTPRFAEISSKTI